MSSRMATWSGYAIITLIPITFAASYFIPYGLISIPICLMIIFHQVILRGIFKGPNYRSEAFSDPEWEVISLNNNGFEVYGFVNWQPNDADMVVFVHGWQSSSKKFTERMRIFMDKKIHTLAIDMRGHGMAADTFEWTAGKVISDIKALLESLDNSRINKIHFYGHSLGGFVCIGMHHHRHQGWWKERYGTLMLESPMVAYSPIMEEMAPSIPLMLPLLKKWAVRGFNRIHPEVRGLQWSDIDVPDWGLPDCPTLLLQAANDRRLGRFHYDLLLEQDINLESHLIESLPHSGNRTNSDRDKLISDWIDNKIL